MVSADPWQHYKHLDIGGYARDLLADFETAPTHGSAEWVEWFHARQERRRKEAQRKQEELEEITARALAHKPSANTDPPISSPLVVINTPEWYWPGSHGWMMVAVERIKRGEWTMADAIAAHEAGTRLCL